MRAHRLPAFAVLLSFGCTLSSVQAQSSHLAALSTRGFVGTNAQILIAGFVISPGPAKKLAIRAAGPALGSTFGLTGFLVDPQLEIHDSSGAIVAGGTNDDWNINDLATYRSVGLYDFPSGSKDAGLVITLPPGAYTAQVHGTPNSANGGTGIASVDIYEADTGSSHLSALSTRGQVGTGSSVLIPGIAISAGSGTRRLLIRASGPALAGLGVAGTLADPTISVTSVSTGATVASNDNWQTPIGSNPVDGTTLAAAFLAAGDFAFQPGSTDSALLGDFVPGNYTVQVSGVNNGTGLSLVEVYDITPAAGTSVTVSASKPNADESGTNPGAFTFTRTGDTLTSLTVNYAVSGAATNGTDYIALPGSVTIPAGATSVVVAVNPLPDLETEGNEAVTVTVSPSPSYILGLGTSATVTIADSPATLYVANLRPVTGVVGSTASGVATLLVNASGTMALLNVSFSNLSSGETDAHLRLGSTGDFVYNLGTGQVTNAVWTFTPTGTYTSTDLLNALKSGNIYVGLDTSTNPQGEVLGTFIQGSGSQAFTAPAAPPAVDLTHATAADAARLLAQATFGPKQSEIDALTNTSVDVWITSQMALPFTSHRAGTDADFAAYGGSPANGVEYSNNRQAAWWKIVTTAPDQLRQRVALALSEMLVVSDVPFSENFAQGLAGYYDILGNGAFGSFRTLLGNVTLNPVMGNYLSMLRNAKADPVAGTSPDENYAREVMQLFTIGLNTLQPDGTLKLDATGLPIPTYNQATITEMARVFTGWSYHSTSANPNFRTSATDYIDAMQLFPAYHDTGAKNIVNGVVIPANQGGATDLQLALDALFNHPNTGPFLARGLIQRLVTSNPSPGYIYRVAQKFADNGSGVRGDLGAVVRAILEDYEARSPSLPAQVGFGKLREPLLRATALVRSFNGTPAGGRFSSGSFTNADVSLDEAALRSPTVFNFFHPSYVLPGPLASAGLVAPEFEITDATFAIDVPNYLRNFIFSTGTPLALDLSYEQTLVTNPSALLDHLNLVLCAGNLSAATRTRITTALAALPASTTSLERAETAVLLVATSPAGSTQK